MRLILSILFFCSLSFAQTFNINRVVGPCSAGDAVIFNPGVFNCSAGVVGTVTNFSSGDLVPLFTTSVANPTTAPTLSFTLTNTDANKFFGGPVSGGAAAPTFRILDDLDIPATIVRTSRTISTTAPLGGGGTLAGNLTLTCTGCLTSVTAHNILSLTHGDSLAASPVLGDIIHGNATPNWARLAGNITVTKQFLTQTGNGAISAVPVWGTILDADIPTTLVRTSRLITSGTGLSGGGDLSADRTLNVGATSPITVAADAVECPTCVTNVTGTAPIVSSGGTTPDISCPSCITSASLADPGGNGIVVRTALNVTTNRTLVGDTEIAVADGTGVGANPTLSIGAAITRDAEINVQGTANEISSSGSGVAPTLSLASQLVISGKEVLGASPIRFEGVTDDNTYTTLAITDPTSARIFTLPNADSNPVQPATCSGTDKVSAISSTGAITCTADTSGGNSVEVSVDLGTGGGLVYTTTVTGQAWVTTSSEIVCNSFATDADGQVLETYYASGINVTTSNRVAATGFDLAVYNPHGATGIFRFHCIGV